jgi:hypothetical protein
MLGDITRAVTAQLFVTSQRVFFAAQPRADYLFRALKLFECIDRYAFANFYISSCDSY